MLAQAHHAFRVQSIETTRPGFGAGDQPGLLEHTQVLRDGRAAHGKHPRQLVHRDGAGDELLKDGHAGGIAEGIESGL